MESYDPLVAPDPVRWLELDEQERLDLVIDHHRAAGVELPNEKAHASFHVIVENQLALDEESVPATLNRLMRQGLDRHDAVHAIGAVMADHIRVIVSDEKSDPGDHRRYFKRLDKLTAKRWLKGKW
jgi:hypothetical protein